MKAKLILLILIAFTSNGYSQNWLWAKSASGTGDDESRSIATDASGNIFVTGKFQSPSITFGNITLTNVGNTNIFIVKYDDQGNVLWAKSAAGAGDDESFSVSTDLNGNAIITGWFNSPSITFGTVTLNNSGGADLFIAKYDSNGNVLWAKSGGGTQTDIASSVCTDVLGNIFVTGYFYSPTIAFGFSNLINADPSGNSPDVFITKYDPNGNGLWTKRAGGISYEQSNAVSTDANGNVFITGYFQSNSIVFGTTTLLNSGSYDVFVAKYDGNGNTLWAKAGVGTGIEQAMSVSADPYGNIFVSGEFYSGSLIFGNVTLTNVADADVFVVKYDPNGNVQWAKSAGGGNWDGSFSISADGAGNAFVSGIFMSSTITFGSHTLSNFIGINTLFIIKYDASGNVLCASNISSGSGTEAVCTDLSGNAYITGGFSANPLIVGSDSLLLTGQENTFIAKYYCDENSSSGIGQQKRQKIFSIYPNPSSGIFTLQSSEKISSVAIFNLLGEKIYSTEINSLKKEIDLSEKPKGIYFVRINSEKENTTRKIIIE